jgi:hypothetical protein
MEKQIKQNLSKVEKNYLTEKKTWEKIYFSVHSMQNRDKGVC